MFAHELGASTGSRMPPTKTPPARRSSSYENASSAAVNAMVERVAPAILGLLADGVPRSKAAIIEALADRHDRQDVLHRPRPAADGAARRAAGRGRPRARRPA